MKLRRGNDRGRRRLLFAYRRDEIVAPPYDSGDVAIVALSVAEGTTQITDLYLQVGFFDERLRPGSGDQLLLADDLAGTFDQCRQDVEGAAAEPHWLVALQQQPLSCKEPIWAKRDRSCVHGAAPRFSLLYTILPSWGQRQPGPIPRPMLFDGAKAGFAISVPIYRVIRTLT